MYIVLGWQTRETFPLIKSNTCRSVKNVYNLTNMASSRNNLHVLWRLFYVWLFWLWKLPNDYLTLSNSVVLSIFFYSDNYSWFCTFRKGIFLCKIPIQNLVLLLLMLLSAVTIDKTNLTLLKWMYFLISFASNIVLFQNAYLISSYF